MLLRALLVLMPLLLPAAAPAAERPLSALPHPQSKLAYSVIVENREGGVIRVVEPPAMFLLNRPGIDIGTVLRPSRSVDTIGFHASSWGTKHSVVASAVNAVHVKVYDNEATGRAGVITLLPAELHGHDLDGKPAKFRDDAIYTNIAGGHGIFGGAWPLIVGNPINVYASTREKLSFDPSRVELAEGDFLVIEVRIPEEWPQGLVIENRSGGAMTLTDASGALVKCGSVDKPITGSGRFAGGVFCATGGIRATHTAVLDLDFSPHKCTGGVQFIPEAHSRSSEMIYSRNSPPYGILLGADGSDLRAQPPLFGGYLYPNSLLEPPVVLPQLRVRVKLHGRSEWQPLPSLIGLTTLDGLDAFRVDWELPEGGVTQAGARTPPSPPASR